jgi:formate hydrogenlyase transcriptional activator
MICCEMNRHNGQLVDGTFSASRSHDSLRSPAHLANSGITSRKTEDGHADFDGIVGYSSSLREVFNLVRTVAATTSTVLIEGETGTGKELIARAIHDHSPRRERPFMKLNCAAIPSGLLESELFGCEKGAFTGAVTRRIGRLEAAHGGTVFLDEVGEIPWELQAKLLRVLQELEFERLGSTRTLRVDVRFVTATNRCLEQMVSEQQLRSDLFYRLHVFPITLPPLRDRPEDIPPLVRHFVKLFSTRMCKRMDDIPDDVMAALMKYKWPGNIRELENFIERCVILSPGSRLYAPLQKLKSTPKSEAREPITLADAERDHIRKTLHRTNGILAGPNGAAAQLGVKRSTLYYRMEKLGISRWTKNVSDRDTVNSPERWRPTALGTGPEFQQNSGKVEFGLREE